MVGILFQVTVPCWNSAGNIWNKALLLCQQCCEFTAVSFFHNPASLGANPKSLLRFGHLCLSSKLLRIGFYDGNADTTRPIAMKILCYLKGSLKSFNWVLGVRKEPRAMLRLLIQPSWIIDHCTCHKLVLTDRAKGDWMEENF